MSHTNYKTCKLHTLIALTTVVNRKFSMIREIQRKLNLKTEVLLICSFSSFSQIFPYVMTFTKLNLFKWSEYHFN